MLWANLGLVVCFFRGHSRKSVRFRKGGLLHYCPRCRCTFEQEPKP